MTDVAMNTQTAVAGTSPAKVVQHTKLADSHRVALTRRGRFVLLGLPALLSAALLLLAIGAFAAGSLASPAQASVAHEPIDMADYAVSVTVLQGDSLWSIASAADPSRDIRDVVGDIVALNDLGSGIVQAGQRLYVPVQK